MNDILATFTRSEKWLISFVLVLVGCGYGIEEFQSSRQNTMSFEVSNSLPDQQAVEVSKFMPTGMTTDGRIDINAADAKLLETLPGVGPALAGALIRARDTSGPFKSMADLDAVPGIGPAMMSKLAPLVEFGGVTASPSVRAPVQSLIQPQAPLPALATSVEGTKVNINTASAEELDLLTGVGPAIARRILEDRQVRGAFRRPDDLMRVKGIGVSIMQKNGDRITVQ